MADDRIGSGTRWLGGGRGPEMPQASATRRAGRRGRTPGYSNGSPLLRRAQPSSRGPAEILPLRPSAAFQSSESLRGDRPFSTVAVIAGHASSVESNRARILFDGISRSEYPTAPSMQISVFSPGAFAYRFGIQGPEKSISGISRSSSSTCVFMPFALRGAPCGGDPRSRTADGDYHDDELAQWSTPDRAEANLIERMFAPMTRPIAFDRRGLKSGGFEGFVTVSSPLQTPTLVHGVRHCEISERLLIAF